LSHFEWTLQNFLKNLILKEFSIFAEVMIKSQKCIVFYDSTVYNSYNCNNNYTYTYNYNNYYYFYYQYKQ